VKKENEMKRFVKVIGFSLQLILACGLVYASDEDKPQTVDELLKSIKSICVQWQPFEITATPEPFPTGAGSVNLQVTVTPHIACEEITVAIDSIDNLHYVGEASLLIKAAQESTFTVDLNIVIPSNDTSGLHVNVAGGEWNRSVPIYFVTMEDTVHYYFGRPRNNLSSTVRKAPKKSIDYSDLSSEPGTVGDPGHGYVIDAEGNVFPDESLGVVDSIGKPAAERQSVAPDRSKVMVKDQDGKWIRVDTAWLFDSVRTAKIEADREKMHKLEETPLTEYNYQPIKVGDTVYVRRRGEYKFHLQEMTTDPTGYTLRYRDSLRISQGKVFEFIFDLRNPADFEYVSGLVDSLIPTDSAGFYRATIDWKTVLQCHEKGISFHKPVWTPYKKPAESPQDHSSEKKKK
jgi:hypothetical protein